MFQPFQKYINRAAQAYGISKELYSAKICHDFKEAVPGIFDKIPQAKDYVSPAHYKNFVLTINVPSPAWAQEVIMRKEKIIDAMNTKAGRKVIRGLRTQLRQG